MTSENDGAQEPGSNDAVVLTILEHGPKTTAQIAVALGMTNRQAYDLLAKLRGHFLVSKDKDTWSLRNPVITRDPSPFPRPAYQAEKQKGWWG